MTTDELTCCACGFSISGFGHPNFFKLIEASMVEHSSSFDHQNIKELCRAFVFSKRGSKEIHQILQPRILQLLEQFTPRELCYLVYGYSNKKLLSKSFAKALEQSVTQSLRDIENVELELIQLIAGVFCRTRVGSRDFHKLLETAVLTRLDELRKNVKILHAIGFEFESSGLCSLDTMRILKKAMFEAEAEQEIFE
mmetsp:Transcript_10015/g.16825  ORF Transcript_10015/g.16825 Transcript_10015/m.16825 type:complete len:196 (+) Transcript_10015:995-1582(+)